MKKLESSLKNMLLVLTGVTAISVALLAYVNVLTKDPIEKANANILNEALKNVLPPFSEVKTDTIFTEKKGKKVIDFIIYPAMSDGKMVGTAVQAVSMGFGGELKILVGFDLKGTIINYSLLSHSETPGLGSKASDWFMKDKKGDITGKNPGIQPLVVKKDGGDIDAITASTITSRAFLKAINDAYTIYTEHSVANIDAQKNVEEVADAITATGDTIKVELTDSVSAK